ncbi:MAG: BLUF domain-containing protein [Polyangiaceae bacterium]
MSTQAISNPDNVRLYQVVYVSAASDAALGGDGLPCLLRETRQKNASVDVTGLMVLVDLAVIEVLEGEQGAVAEAFGSWRRDKRRENLFVLQRGPIDGRRFGACPMRVATLDAVAVRLVGLSESVRNGRITRDAVLHHRILGLIDELAERAFDNLKTALLT